MKKKQQHQGLKNISKKNGTGIRKIEYNAKRKKNTPDVSVTEALSKNVHPDKERIFSSTMISRRGPTVISVPVHSTRGQSGINCCCCRCCSCIHFEFLKTGPGRLKLAEVIIGFFCQSLAFQYGSSYSGTIGPSFHSFVTNVAWCFSTTFLLLICYLFSPKSVNLVKSSLFETLFNMMAAFSYFSTCSYLGYVVNVVLEPVYVITPQYQVFPAMSAAYMAGTLLGCVYAYDAYKSYRYFKGYRR